jgi:hypothetical protein
LACNLSEVMIFFLKSNKRGSYYFSTINICFLGEVVMGLIGMINGY